MTSDYHDFPLGTPVNRAPAPAPTPIDGRPNWYRDPKGREFYREPGQQKPDNSTGEK